MKDKRRWRRDRRREATQARPVRHENVEHWNAEELRRVFAEQEVTIARLGLAVNRLCSWPWLKRWQLRRELRREPIRPREINKMLR